MAMRLLSHATFIFHDEDFCKIEEYLKQDRGFTDDPKYLEKLMDHSYFNKEWWQSRCRMYVAKADDHAEPWPSLESTCRILRVHPCGYI